MRALILKRYGGLDQVAFADYDCGERFNMALVLSFALASVRTLALLTLLILARSSYQTCFRRPPDRR
jgi:hypothetical protein